MNYSVSMRSTRSSGLNTFFFPNLPLEILEELEGRYPKKALDKRRRKKSIIRKGDLRMSPLRKLTSVKIME